LTPEQFLQFAEPLPEPMLLVSTDGNILAANRAMVERLNRSLVTLLGRQLNEIVADSAEDVTHYLHACARSKQIVLGSVAVIGDDKQTVDCRSEGALLRPRQESSQGLLLLRLIPKASTVGKFIALNQRIEEQGKEIHRRKHAEEALRTQKELLRVTLASIGDAVITTDTDGNVTYLNPVAELLTGWKTEVAAGEPLDVVFNIVNERSRRPVANPAVRALEEGMIVGLANHTVLISRDGTEWPIDDSAAPIRGSEGEVVGCVLVFRDVTEKKRAETDLREAGDRKDEFLAMLAHELRNPLAPIRNAIQIIRLAPSDADATQTACEMMERQISQMVRLVDDLLDVSRVSRGRIDLRRERVALTAIIAQAIETSRPAVECAKHDLIVTLPPEPVYLFADPIRLAQVFNNLLNNSCKYSEPHGRIWLKAELEGSDVLVSVKDTGFGIPREMLPKIFEMFTQLDRSLERSQGGLGIGLTLAQRLVEMHEGSVDALSDGLGFGSEFIVRLPILIETSTSSNSADRPGNGALSPTTRRILVVDDNRDSALSLAMLLKLGGNETLTAFDGRDAVDSAATFRPEVILLDIGLPKLNGYEAAREIREQAWGKSMILIALTGWGQESDREKSKEAGFNSHLVKPVDRSVLMNLLAELMPDVEPA
jgi:PAS domain S-box-containing protein